MSTLKCPTPDDPDLPVAMVRTTFALREVLQARFRAVKPEITPAELGLLHLLTLEDGQRVGSLADESVRDRTTITRVADRLVAKKLLVRKEDPEDRRAVRHWLTPAGRRLHARLMPIRQEVVDHALKGLSPRRREDLIEALQRIRENLLSLQET